MANSNDRRRNAKRARKTPEVASALFEKPEDPNCVETKLNYEIDDADFRISIRLVTLDQRLVEFCIVLSRVYGNDTPEVYSVDSQHGWLHEHTHGHTRPKDRRDIKPLFSQVDVQESHDTALQMVLTKYQKLRG